MCAKKPSEKLLIETEGNYLNYLFWKEKKTNKT